MFLAPSNIKIGIDHLRAANRYSPLQPENEVEVAGKTVVITGASTGIGAVLAHKMAARGARTLMCCRDMTKAAAVQKSIKEEFPAAVLELFSLELGSLDSIRSCAQEIKEKVLQVDVLVNNAAVMYGNKFLRFTSDGFEAHMGINHLGNFLFTILLLELLKKGSHSRIVFVGSNGYQYGNLDVNDFMLEKRGAFGFDYIGPYANSKIANMYFARNLAERCRDSCIHVYTVCPGYVKTDMFRHQGWLRRAVTTIRLYFLGVTPEQGADTVLYCAISKTSESESGLMYRFNHVWENALDFMDEKICRQVWTISEGLVGVRTTGG